MPLSLRAHTLRRRPRSLSIRLRLMARVLAKVALAVAGRIPQVGQT